MDRNRPLFFIHVMKTGGLSLSAVISSLFKAEEIFPSDDMSHLGFSTYTDLKYLRNISADRKKKTRFFSGHYPYIASKLLDIPLTTVTVLRNPVERVVSHLRQISRNKSGWRKLTPLAHASDPSLLDVYQDEFLKDRFFVNHQVKMFAFTSASGVHSYMDPLKIDEGSLEIAIKQLQEVDLIGFQHCLDDFMTSLAHGLGASHVDIIRKNVAPVKTSVPEELVFMIEKDNELDIRFYQAAQKIARGETV